MTPAPLHEHHLLVSPDYGGFDLRDPDSDAGGDPILVARALADTVAGNDYEICINTAQQHSRVGVDLYIWNTEPSADHSRSADTHELTLRCPSNTLLIDQRTYGPASDAIPLPGPDEAYRLRITTTSGEAASRATQAVFTDNDDLGTIRAELRELEGTERFTIDIWPAPPASPGLSD